MIKKSLITLIIYIASCSNLHADEADVIDVEVIKNSDGSYTFNVTVQHNDEGWNHYADHWLILDKEDNLLGARKIMHPHVKEQPFTRSLSYIPLPDEVNEIIVRAHCSKDGYSGNEYALSLTR